MAQVAERSTFQKCVVALRLTATLAALLVAVSGSVVVAQGGPRSYTSVPLGPDTIVIGQSTDVAHGDPAYQIATPEIRVGRLTFDALVRRDKDMAIAPAIASSWTLLDDLTWQFELRQDVRFHDGTPLKASDVVYTFDRLLDSTLLSTQGQRLTMIERIEAIDDYTVRFTTKQPDAVFLSRLLFAPIVPEAYVKAVGDDAFNRQPIGTGPFSFVEWVRDSHVVLKRNNDYWGGAPVADNIVFRTIPEASARVAALLTGEVDIIDNVPPDLIPTIEDDPNTEVALAHSNRFMFVGMNTNTPPLNDVRVRQALNYAVDSDALIQYVLNGMAYPHGLPLGNNIYGFDPTIEPYGYDPEKAKSLLAEAGYANGIDLTLAGPRGRYMKDAELIEAIAGQLAAAGIRTTISLSEFGTYWPSVANGEQKNLWFLGLGSSTMDPDEVYRAWLTSAGWGGQYYHNAEVEDLIFSQNSILNVDERLAALSHITREIVADAPWIFLWDQSDVYAKRVNIAGWEPLPSEEFDFNTVTRQ